jgi:hypothetical protein
MAHQILSAFSISTTATKGLPNKKYAIAFRARGQGAGSREQGEEKSF